MSYFDQLLEYSQSEQNIPSWYRFSENRDVVTLEENSNLLKINTQITYNDVFLHDTNRRPMEYCSKEQAIRKAKEINGDAIELGTKDGLSIVYIDTMLRDIRFERKIALRVKSRPWLVDFSKKINSSENYDAWPRSSKKEHQSIQQHSILIDHEKHDHECEIDLDGNIVQYRQSHNPRQGKFICNELDNKIISTIQSTVI